MPPPSFGDQWLLGFCESGNHFPVYIAELKKNERLCFFPRAQFACSNLNVSADFKVMNIYEARGLSALTSAFVFSPLLDDELGSAYK